MSAVGEKKALFLCNFFFHLHFYCAVKKKKVCGMVCVVKVYIYVYIYICLFYIYYIYIFKNYFPAALGLSTQTK